MTAETAKFEQITNDNPIIPAPTAIETFRDSGYKSTAAALAELIDNSIEANASRIQVLTFEEPVTLPSRTVYRINKIAVYDDGKGMTPHTLMLALQFGMGTRLQSRKGIGRFGIGLPNASVSQCRHVQVYSWQEGKCYTTYLDLDEIRENQQQNSNPIMVCDLPHEILDQVEGELDKDSGTLVVWSQCDRLDINRSSTLYNNMERDLCRIYRHFLDNDNSYGNKIDVKLVATGKDRVIMQLIANDPMYLLTPNNTPGQTTSTNVLYGDVIPLDVPYDDEGHTSRVEIRFTMALPEIQGLGGGSKLGKHYEKNTGISIVRACREIDFDDFGFFNPREERQRWWGCEIRFEPVLDELFGVTNNKQSVRNIRYLDTKEFEKEHGENIDKVIAEDKKLWLLYHISKCFKGNNSKIMDTITSRHEGKRSKGVEDTTSEEKSTKVANEQLIDSKAKTKSLIEGQEKTDEEKRSEWMNSLEKRIPNLTEEELTDLVDRKAQLKIDFDFGVWPGEQFFSIETRGDTLIIVINKRHSFYTELYEPLCKETDSRFINAIDLLLMAYARVEDELYSYEDELQEIRSKWGNYVQKFLKALKEEA